VNYKGKYGVRLTINGCERLVELDDRLMFNLKTKQHTLCYSEPLQ